MAATLHHPRPMVRTAAGLQHKRRLRSRPEVLGELGPAQPMPSNDPTAFRLRHLKDKLCRIHRNERRFHLGLLLLVR